MAGCRELMDGTEKLHEAGFWPSPEKVFDSTLSDSGIKSYQHMLKDTREPLSPLLMGTLRYSN